jgi:hypothetical protein
MVTWHSEGVFGQKHHKDVGWACYWIGSAYLKFGEPNMDFLSFVCIHA